MTVIHGSCQIYYIWIYKYIIYSGKVSIIIKSSHNYISVKLSRVFDSCWAQVCNPTCGPHVNSVLKTFIIAMCSRPAQSHVDKPCDLTAMLHGYANVTGETVNVFINSAACCTLGRTVFDSHCVCLCQCRCGDTNTSTALLLAVSRSFMLAC